MLDESPTLIISTYHLLGCTSFKNIWRCKQYLLGVSRMIPFRTHAALQKMIYEEIEDEEGRLWSLAMALFLSLMRALSSSRIVVVAKSSYLSDGRRRLSCPLHCAALPNGPLGDRCEREIRCKLDWHF